jgi:hypothetical protein
MKKLFSLAILLFAVVAQSTAASYTTVTVKDSISTNTTWTNNQQYLLKGYVYVTSGTTLTIEKGTIIRGDKDTKGALIIERGAKIMANGDYNMPIIFTSNQPQGSRSYGDWGGVIVCGKAPVNWTAGEAQVEGGPRSFYGGTDAADNSGSMTFVRIEFGGIAFSPNNEVNGLTLCGVGNGTTIHHIQVSYSGDDSYEFFGGTVNAKNLISHRSWDDDFDSDNGFSGMVQYGIVLRDPYAADQSGSKAIETDSYLAGTIDGKTDNSKATKAVFSNMTLIGPLVNAASSAYDNQFVAGVHIRRGSSLSLYNSIVMGWPAGIVIDESSSSYGSTTKNIGLNDLMIKSNIIAGNGMGLPVNFPQGVDTNKNIMYVKDGARNLTPTTANADSAITGNCDFSPYAGPFTMLQTVSGFSRNLQYASATNGARLQAPFDLTSPKFYPTSTSPVCFNNGKNWLDQTISGLKAFDPTKAINTDTTGLYTNYNAPGIIPNFTDTKTNNSFFDKVNFVGALAYNTGDWTVGWSNYDPNNTFYDYVVGIKEIATNIEAAVVYPNPAVNSATVKVTFTNTTDLNITVVDMTGRKVQDVFSGNNISGTQIFAINTQTLTAGMYFVNITTGEAQKSIKLSIAK